MADPGEVLLLETVDVLRELLGELIDLQPPSVQDNIAELQTRLLEAVAQYDHAHR